MFIDKARIFVKSGNGGNGAVSFRREKYVPAGGPDGGDGGNGASVIFEVDLGLRTLMDFKYQRKYVAEHGEDGSKKRKAGRNGEDLILKVPPGTIIRDEATGLVIADLKEEGDRAVVAKGGRGGKGNQHFANAVRQAPAFARSGSDGVEKWVVLELKMIADVGLLGFPNVGKSTFLSVVTKAKPKIANYHFTTLTPNLGVVRVRENNSFVVADLPGLIEGASLGEGLGEKFLKHIERTRVIAHVIDMAGTEGRCPYDDYVIITNELKNFNEKILDKAQIIIANKMDMPGAKENLEQFKEKVKNIKIFEVSALNNEGLKDVISELGDMLAKIKKEPLYTPEKFESHVLYKFEEEEPFRIYREGNTFVITGDVVEKLLKMTKFNTDEAALRFANKLKKLGVDDKLREMGATDGDNVRILDFEFDYKES